MSVKSFQSNIINAIKVLEEDSRVLRKELKRLKKLKRKQRRLTEEDESLLTIYEADLEANECEIKELEGQLQTINVREEVEEELSVDSFMY